MHEQRRAKPRSMPRPGAGRTEQPGGALRSPWLAIGLIVLAVSCVYSNSLSGPFVLDDDYVVAKNPSIRSLWAIRRVLNPPGNGMPVQGRPVVNLSLAVNYALGGEAVPGYHLFNVAVHILAVLVLFGVVRRTLLLPGLPERLAGQSTGLALVIALLWGVHPLATAAVTYITQRAELLMALLYLLTLYCVIRSATGGRPGVWHTAAVLACLLGMASKEVMVSAPLTVLLYDRLFLSGSWKESFRQRGLLYAGLAATWVLLAWLVVAAGGRGGTAGFGWEVGWREYALTQCQAVVTYLKLCFWPYPLVLDYGTAVVTDPLKVWPQALLLALLVGGVLAAFCWRPRVGFLGLGIFAILAPSSSVVPVTTQTMAEHRMYLPLAIIVALSVLLLCQGWERIWVGWEQGRQRWRWVPALALAVTAIPLGGLTLRRNAEYQPELRIWTDTVNKCPANERAHNNLGNAYLHLGKYDEAVKHFSRAIALRPDWVVPYNNLGNAYENLGQFQQALAGYGQAIALRPDFADAFYNRGNTYLRLGQPRRALEDFTQAVRFNANYLQAYNNRGNVYQDLGQFQEALADYNRILAVDPAYADAYFNRGNTYQKLGQFQRAIDDYNRVIALKPGYYQAYNGRGNALQELGQFQQAIADYNQAIALKPDFAEPYSNRGNAYESLGQFAQAIQDHNQAIQRNPRFGEAYSNRASALCRLKQYDQAWADLSRAKQLGCVPPAELVRRLSEATGRSGN